jgi:pre-mRNA-splicing factor CDC5/CEF1
LTTNFLYIYYNQTMRILVKGGVWKNTEDEVLKAAVMKYGKNQWARVASLLNRKSAKQCKARWYEWLDPSIKKTEWNKEEEEKLLHLAKLMPNQWRTIAPIVGRTAGQCIEHYERLLDQAQEGVAEDIADDPRRLRPGEIDPTPETKPARPDPIDMDEDEKEMLSEAKARLANTKGKKAKRKARERQLDESKRLSMLQKRRELKAAGIESKMGGMKKRKHIDYGKEIPFQKVAPAGFYDVREEDMDAKRVKLDPKLQGIELSKLEGRHDQEDEERAKQRDKKVLKTMFKENAPLTILKIASQNDPTALRRRAPLSLPIPQISDGELEDIIKMNNNNQLMGPPEGAPHGQALIGDYSRSLRAPQSTPLRTPVQEDIVMQEARNLRVLREMTPLLGGDVPQMYEGTGFEGVAPRSAKMATPNVVYGSGSSAMGLTPLAHGTPFGHGGSLMIGNGNSSNSSVMSSRTPLRDQFGLNAGANTVLDARDSDNFSVSDVTSISSRMEKQRSRHLREQISSQLKGLPEPEYTYDVSLPQVEDVEDNDLAITAMTGKPEDAADTRAAHLEAKLKREQYELSLRSSVLKRGLPRPFSIAARELAKPSLDPTKHDAVLVEASAAINQEMVVLLQYDAFRYPVETTKGSAAKVVRAKAVELEMFSDDYLEEARTAIAIETKEAVDSEEGQRFIGSFGIVWDESHKALMFLPDSSSKDGGVVLGVPRTKNETLSALTSQYTALKVRFDKDAKKVAKAENKLTIITQGYSGRAQQLQQNVDAAYDEFYGSQVELNCNSRLSDQELKAVPRRLAGLRTEALIAETAEKSAQKQYADIVSYAKSVGVKM